MVRLSLQDRLCIIVNLKQSVSQRQIAAQLHCSHTAVQKSGLQVQKVQEMLKTFQSPVVLVYLQHEKST